MANLSTSNDAGEVRAAAPDFRLYRPPSSDLPSTQGLDDLPDSYFTPTSSDLKAAQAALAARTESLVNAPFQVRAAREAAEKTRRDKWPMTTIRVRFPDRTQLEKVFPSTEKIRSVYAFVRSCLREDVKPIKFVLYQSPPKRDLKVSDPNVRDLTFSELQLAPSSILLLRFVEDSLNGSNIPAPLAEPILAHAEDLPIPQLKEAPPESQTKAKGTPTASVASGSAGKKVPKWFKMGLKK